MGIGFFWNIATDDQDGTHYVHHGGLFGTQSFIALIPRHEIGLFIVTNKSAPDTADHLLAALNGILDDVR
ncbi:MAG: hypothetical protein AAFQ65_07665 [Myxococcota bacterium]